MDRLTPREKEVAEMVAWGASAKEVPGLLRKKSGGREISVYTVQNILARIYAKIHLNKANELSAWWFTHTHPADIVAPLPELGKRILGFFLLLLLLPQIANADIDQAVRASRTRSPRPTEQVARSRRKDENV